jgi:hypothetical protein
MERIDERLKEVYRLFGHFSKGTTEHGILVDEERFIHKIILLDARISGLDTNIRAAKHLRIALIEQLLILPRVQNQDAFVDSQIEYIKGRLEDAITQSVDVGVEMGALRLERRASMDAHARRRSNQPLPSPPTKK